MPSQLKSQYWWSPTSSCCHFSFWVPLYPCNPPFCDVRSVTNCITIYLSEKDNITSNAGFQLLPLTRFFYSSHKYFIFCVCVYIQYSMMQHCLWGEPVQKCILLFPFMKVIALTSQKWRVLWVRLRGRQMQPGEGSLMVWWWDDSFMWGLDSKFSIFYRNS